MDTNRLIRDQQYKRRKKISFEELIGLLCVVMFEFLWCFVIDALWKICIVIKPIFAPKTCTHSRTQTYSHSDNVARYFLFESSTGASLNDFWQIYPVVQMHPEINCPFPLSPPECCWIQITSLSPFSCALLLKVGPVTHKWRRELDNVGSSTVHMRETLREKLYWCRKIRMWVKFNNSVDIMWIHMS